MLLVIVAGATLFITQTTCANLVHTYEKNLLDHFEVLKVVQTN